jgi:hypothetical protein
VTGFQSYYESILIHLCFLHFIPYCACSCINYGVFHLIILEIDNSGVIEPDNDPPQEMGDDSIEVCM